MRKRYKRHLKTYEEMRCDLASERALNREMRHRLRDMRAELRSAKARANDLAHLLAVSGLRNPFMGGSARVSGHGAASGSGMEGHGA